MNGTSVFYAENSFFLNSKLLYYNISPAAKHHNAFFRSNLNMDAAV